MSFPPYLPKEILCDILLPLNRNEIEKCQLISREFCYTIFQHAPILPLYLFYRLKIGEDSKNPELSPNPLVEKITLLQKMGSVPTEISNDEDSDEIIDSLKNCIFVSCGPVKMNLPTYASIQWLAKMCGEKIKTIVFSTFGPFYDKLADCADLLPRILDNCIQAEKISITLNEEDTKNFLQNPQILKIPFPPTEITLNCDTFTFDSSQLVLNLLSSQGLLGANRYSIKLSSLTDGADFCEKFLEKFRSTEDLDFLVRNIRFAEWHPFLFDSCIDILNKNKLTSTVMVKGSATAFVYEAKRFGWTLKIFLRRHIYETIAKCTAEFTVSKCC